jgi:hypothetical protein
MPNLVKELDNSVLKRKKTIQKSTVLNEVQNLLEYDTQRDMSILRTIGSNSSFVQSEEEKVRVMELEKKEDYFAGKVFTKEQIMKLGAKYRLKFLLSTEYTGYIDPSVVQEIKEMERSIVKKRIKSRAEKENVTVEEYLEQNPDKTRFQLDSSDFQRRFHILAPAKLFKTEKSPSFSSIPSTDPIMFYTDDDKYFRLIKKWGTDLSIFRRVLGWLGKSWQRAVLTLFFLPPTIVTVVLSAVYDWYIMFFLGGILLTLVLFSAHTQKDIDFDGERYVTSRKRFFI